MTSNNVETGLPPEYHPAQTQEEIKALRQALAHDVKAPLKGALSLVEWLAEDYSDDLDAEGQKMLKSLKSRMRRVDLNIAALIRYLELAQSEEEPEPVDLNDILKDTLRLLKKPDNINIKIKNTLPTVLYRPGHSQIIFENLLSNAINFMDKTHGEIIITADEFTDFWQIGVADNGPGIEALHYEHIFAMFKTLAPRNESKSTGMGLALVKKSVELEGGRVWLESVVGKGSTFYFTIPKKSLKSGESMAQAIILMGVAGSGKSTIGTQLARQLNWKFYDGDDFHPPANIQKMSNGIPLNDDDRLPWLKNLQGLIKDHLAEGESLVVACSALKQWYRDILINDNPAVSIIYLRGSYELLLARMRSRQGHFMKEDMLKSQFEALEEPDDVFTVDISASVEDIINQILTLKFGANT